jgi:AcrR family transcriptional regulator
VANRGQARRKRTAPPEAEAPPSDVKERIYNAALSLFGRKGYAAVSVREICREARTTPPMVYYYFGSKRGLYRAILDESIQYRRRQVEEALKSGGTPLERLRGVLEAWAGAGEEPALKALRAFFSRELFGLGSEMYARRVEDSDRAFRQTLKKIIQDGIDQGVFRPVRVEMTVLAITGILHTFSRRIALGAPLSLDEAVHQVMDGFVYGLAVRPEAPAAPPDAGEVAAALVR